jgi:hypothetical protein
VKTTTIMPKEPTTIIYCTAAARDGKGGFYKVGEKLEFDKKEPAHKLLATGRFTTDPEVAKEAKSKISDKAKAAEADAAKDDEISKLKEELAEAKKELAEATKGKK